VIEPDRDHFLYAARRLAAKDRNRLADPEDIAIELGVNQHRTGTPLAIGANTFIQCHYQRFGGVPIGADRDPPVQRILDIESKVVTPAGEGSRFGADSHFSRSGVVRDAVAGATLASMNIPQVLGYTRIAGTPVVTGLYTVLLPLVAFGCLAPPAICGFRRKSPANPR
jgi:hypothetical protein